MPAPSLLVLAAGMGSRYGGLKQIEPVGPGGETLLDYSVYDALRAGFGRVVFIIRHSIEEDFRAIVGKRFEGKVDVRYAFQELDTLPPGFSLPEGRTKPWGTTHAVLAAQDAIAEPFAAINADDFYGQSAFRVLAEHFASGSPDYALVGFRLNNTLSDHGTVARGVCQVSPDGYLQRVEEMTAIARDGAGAVCPMPDGSERRFTGDETVSMNFWGFLPNVFGPFATHFEGFLREHIQSEKAELYIPSAIDLMIRVGTCRLKVLTSNDPWLGVTYREDLPTVKEGIERLVAAGQYPERLWA